MDKDYRSNLYNKHIYQIAMQDMQKIIQIKERILEVIKQNGPEFPVRVAKATGGNNIFTAAFMSELVSEQKLKISNMRVGSSPLYYIVGQEEQLQKYSDHLNHKEKEAFKLIKQKEILLDIEQEPAIRVALRSIKDFAIPIKIRDGGEEKIFWKIHTLSNGKAKEIIEQLINPPIKKETIQNQKVEEPNSIIEEIPVKKVKEISSKFLEKTREKILEMQYEITGEFSTKKKELSGKLKVKTALGDQEYYFIAKDKKKITIEDIVNALQKAQLEKMPALILSPGDIDKKAQAYFQEWSNLIKYQKIS